MLLTEIEKAVTKATPEQVRTTLENAGLADRANENRERLRRAMAQDYRKDMAPQIEGATDSFAEFPDEDPGRCRVRLRFALAANPALETTLGTKLTTIDNMPDDVMMGYYEKLQGIKS